MMVGLYVASAAACTRCVLHHAPAAATTQHVNVNQTCPHTPAHTPLPTHPKTLPVPPLPHPSSYDAPTLVSLMAAMGEAGHVDATFLTAACTRLATPGVGGGVGAHRGGGGRVRIMREDGQQGCCSNLARHLPEP